MKSIILVAIILMAVFLVAITAFMVYTIKKMNDERKKGLARKAEDRHNDDLGRERGRYGSAERGARRDGSSYDAVRRDGSNFNAVRRERSTVRENNKERRGF